MRQIGFTIIITVLLVLVGCDRKPEMEQPSSEKQSAADPVLAKVGSSTVRQSQFDVMMDRLTPEARKRESAKLHDTILQGLVRTRALAIVTEQQLSEEEKIKLDAKVQLYKDELLAQAYLQKNMEPQPVTSGMVKKYYEEHQKEFTIPGKVNFEYLATTAKKLKDTELDKVIKALSTAKNEKNWKAYSDKLQKQNLPVEYKSAIMVPASVIKVLRTQVEQLKEGEVSDLIQGDYIYVVKVNKRDPDVVKPINQVSVEIRKKLAPQQLKQALSQHIDQALQKVKVEYIK
jgi:hypothetical protein